MNKGFLKYLTAKPKLAGNCWIAKNATLIGSVSIGAFSSVWPNAVLRGDINRISIQEKTNLQEGVIIHVGENHPVEVGSRVTIGHAAVVHGCQIEDNCLIGMHATILDGAHIGTCCIIGAHTLVTQKQKIPSRSLVLGSPGKVVRSLTEEEIRLIEESAQIYVELTQAYLALDRSEFPF